MCIKFVRNFLQSKSKKIHYSELKEVKNEPVAYSLLDCTYKSNNMQITKPEECKIKINRDSIELKNDKVKYDYISHFTKLSNRSVGILMFTKINGDYKMIKNDSLSIIIVKFTSNNTRQSFINTVFEQIKLYKSYDLYDKSVYDFKIFKQLKLKRSL